MISPIRKALFRLAEQSVYPHLFPNGSYRPGYFEAIYQSAGARIVLLPFALNLAFALGALFRYFRPLSKLSDEQIKRYYQFFLYSRWYSFRMVAYALKSHALIAAGRLSGAARLERAPLLHQEGALHEV